MAEETEKKNEETLEGSEEQKQESTEEKQEHRTLTQEEINKLIESTRKQEKDKLYDTISSLKKQVSSLSDERKQQKEEEDKIKKEADEKAEQERLAKMSAEDKLAEQLKRFEERLVKEAEQREALQNQLDQAKQEQEIEKYKAQVLNEAGDEIIPDLVRGNTKEEIEASAAIAKEKYQHFFQAALQRAEGNKTTETSTEKPQMPTPANPDPDPLDEEGMRGLIPQLDPDDASKTKVSDEYKKNRDQILAKVASAYGKTANRQG